MPEPKQPCQPHPILRVETIAEYLECTPGKVRTTLANIQNGSYCIEVSVDKWVRVISVKVELKAGLAWTPVIKQEGE